jgi:hypothetical protein
MEMWVEPLINFGDLVTGLQRLPEREKLILMALINGQGRTKNRDVEKVERMIAQTLIAAARNQRRYAEPKIVVLKSKIARQGQRALAAFSKAQLDPIAKPAVANAA